MTYRTDFFKWLLEMFPDKGYFVEAGAHDGVGDSHTKLLEDHGWTGICVEPSSAFNGLKRSRKCHVDNRCLWSTSGVSVPFLEVSGNGVELSGIQQCFRDKWDRNKMPHTHSWKETICLTGLLRQYNAPSTIEFLSLDTEGSEWDILATHRFDLYCFKVILVEHNGNPALKKDIQLLLQGHNYVCHEDYPYNHVEDLYQLACSLRA